MWLIDRLLATPAHVDIASNPAASGDARQPGLVATGDALHSMPEVGGRRLMLKRPVRAGRVSFSPWQKVAAPLRRSRH